MRASPTHSPVRPEWLATCQEEILEPAIPVIDAHHHLYDRPGSRYLLDDFLADIRCGHDVRATVIVQARSMLRLDAPPVLQPIGETEFANGVAAMSASGIYGPSRICAGIVGQADLLLGDGVRPILERHISAAGGMVTEGGRFRGIRQPVAWDPDASLVNPAYSTAKDTMDSPAFRAGFAHLRPLGLSFDAWLFFHQIPRLTALARAFPDTPIVLDHCGGIIGIGEYAGRKDEVFGKWRAALRDLAACPNVTVKLSGLGMRLGGFGFEQRERAPSSEELATSWRPWVENCIEAFGAGRCMFGSNFPVDKGSYSYAIGLNALKRIAAGAGEDEKADIFWRTAQRFYRVRAPGMQA
ncbi:amidohydrolase family protein [Variovorax paradoxus]|nr:amidohydrolase family protein [Variovorax paradoxus]MBT2305235.1 amidohydrolase family protein [Variovorax paradoxus]